MVYRNFAEKILAPALDAMADPNGTTRRELVLLDLLLAPRYVFMMSALKEPETRRRGSPIEFMTRNRQKRELGLRIGKFVAATRDENGQYSIEPSLLMDIICEVQEDARKCTTDTAERTFSGPNFGAATALARDGRFSVANEALVSKSAPRLSPLFLT